jgi:hypothetical protein
MTMDDFYAEQEYLEHYGIKGMRWGIRRTPEQLGHYIERTKKKISKNVQLAKAAKASGDVKTLNKLNKRTSKLIAKVEQAEKELPNAKTKEEQIEERKARHAETKAAREAKAAAKKEAARQEFLKTATAEELLSRKSEYSAQELKDAITRIETETKLKELGDARNRASMDKAQKWLSSAKSLGDSAVNAFNTYTNVAKAVNKITGEETLPTFDRDSEKKSKSKKLMDTLVTNLDADAVLKSNLSSEDKNTAIKRIEEISKSRNTIEQQKRQYEKAKANESKSTKTDDTSKTKDKPSSTESAKSDETTKPKSDAASTKKEKDTSASDFNEAMRDLMRPAEKEKRLEDTRKKLEERAHERAMEKAEEKERAEWKAAADAVEKSKMTLGDFEKLTEVHEERSMPAIVRALGSSYERIADSIDSWADKASTMDALDELMKREYKKSK